MVSFSQLLNPLGDCDTFALIITLLFGTGGVLGALFRPFDSRLRTRLSLSCALAGSLFAALGALVFWLYGQPVVVGGGPSSWEMSLPFGMPPLGLRLFVDRLSAFFLLLTGALSAGVALYSFVWLSDKKEQHRIAGTYNLFVLFTLLLLMTGNVYFFVIFMECMTLAFSYLTLYRHNILVEKEGIAEEEIAGAKRAFGVYLVSSHVSVIFVTAALVLLALHAGDFGFDALRNHTPAERPVLADTVFLLALVGLGIKGGFAPSHPWVSIVHPKSPTTTHALTLGLVIKVSSFYMLIRIFFEFLLPARYWWGCVVLLVAGVTAVVGVFYAISSRDLKTALSNHSVENFGIILGGIGLALLLSSGESSSPLAGLAMVAGLYHLLNHTLFKGLLYLCTGAIENRCGTVELEKLGGLMRRFPWTSATFLVGSVAIAGFPPLNGFISEWLTLQVLFAGLDFSDAASGSYLVMVSIFAAILMLGISFGLTALAFVKMAGETLLGAPRWPELPLLEKKGDVPWKMRGVLVLLALLCLLAGIFPGVVVSRLSLIAGELGLMEGAWYDGATVIRMEMQLPGERGSYAAGLSMLPLLALSVPPLLLAALIAARRGRATRGPVWNCGTPHLPDTMQITGGAFSFLTWEWASGRYERGERDAGEGLQGGKILPWRLPVSETRYVSEYFRRTINAALDRLVSFSQWFGDNFQGGDIRRYLLYLFFAFVLVLVVSVAWKGG